MYMPFLSAPDRTFLRTVSEFAYCNPFLPEHTRLEREALGDEFVEGEPVWSQQVNDPERPRENVWRIFEKVVPLCEQLRGQEAGRDFELYEDAVLHLLYQRYYHRFFEASFGAQAKSVSRWAFYHEFREDWRRFLGERGDPRHVFACFRQIQAAFEQDRK